MATLSVGGTTVFDGATLQSGVTFESGTVFPSGHMIHQAHSYTGAIFATDTAIPADDTIPQITEGAELTNITFTPKSASSTIVIDARMQSGKSNVGGTFSNAIALFVDSTANALTVGYSSVVAGAAAHCSAMYTVASGSTTARVYRMRVGSSGGAQFNLNTLGGTARVYGGVALCGMSIYEIIT